MPVEALFPQATAAIVTEAFLRVELSPPASFGDDSEQAQSAALFYPDALRACLEHSDWSFASTFQMLPEVTLPLGVTADTDLPHAYALPGDLVRLREVGSRATRWRIDGTRLRADEPGPLRLRYTALIINETSATSRFRQALAADLALRLAPRWLGTASKIAELRQHAEDALRIAARDDRATASQATWHGGSAEDWGSAIAR